MLESISWKEFFSGVAVFGGLYYAVAWVMLYREELKTLFTEGLAPRNDKSGDGDSANGEEISLIGGISRPAKEEESDEELKFAPGKVSGEDEAEGFTATLDATVVGTVADLGEDIKKLANDISQATRGQVGERFRTLLKKYAKLDATSYRSTINMLIAETIREKSTHAIDAKEVDTWW